MVRSKAAHVVGDLPYRPRPVAPVFQRYLDIGLVQALAADHRRIVRDFRDRLQVIFELARYFIRPRQIGIGRQFDGDAETAFVSLGHEFRTDQARRDQGRCGDKQDQDGDDQIFGVIQAPGQDRRIVVAGAFFDGVHFMPNRFVRDFQAQAEQARCQHRRQRKGNEEGKECGKDDGQAELFEILADHARHEGNRQENDDIAEGDGDSSHANFRPAVKGC